MRSLAGSVLLLFPMAGCKADGSAIGGSGNRGTVGGGMAQGITCATEPLVDYTLTIHHPDWTF